MRLVLFVALGLAACLVQHSLLACWWWAPDLPLALAAWAMIDGDEEGVPLRAVLLGTVHDLADPGSEWFHLLLYGGLALALLPVRRLFFRTRALAWALWAAVAGVVALLADACTGPGLAVIDPLPAAVVVLATALAAMPIGWLFGGLPRAIRPVGVGGA